MAKKTPFDSGTKTVRLKWWKILWRVLVGRTIPQKLFRAYIVVIFLGSILLYLPISLQHGYTMVLDNDVNTRTYTYWDAFFIGVSAITNTGLTPAVISETLTTFGQVVMVVLMEFGGLGLMTIIYLIWNLFRFKNKESNLNQIIMLQSERGNAKIAGTFKSLKVSVSFILICQIVFMFLYSFWLCWMPVYQQIPATFDGNNISTISSLTTDGTEKIAAYGHYGTALWQGLFFTVSSINNAGFDNFNGGVSIAAFRNDWNVVFQVMVLCQIIIGGIGFPLIYDVIEKIRCKHKGIPYKLTLFGKVALISYIVVGLITAAAAFGFEYGYTGYQSVSVINNDSLSVSIQSVPIYDIAHYKEYASEFGKNVTFNKCWAIFFNSMATRSAGVGTINQSILAPGSQWLYIVTMFIGGSPSSTAGGIRTTTLAIIMITILAKIKGRKDVNIFHRKIPVETVRESFLVTLTAVMLVAISAIVIFYTLSNQGDSPEQYTVLQCVYEATSAFGTVGFSMGITSYINHFGQIVLCLIMFVGQLGVSSMLLSWTRKNPKGNRVYYPEEDIRIG